MSMQVSMKLVQIFINSPEWIGILCVLNDLVREDETIAEMFVRYSSHK